MSSAGKAGTSTTGGEKGPPQAARLYNAPRQSTATQIRLKVIQGSIERLMAEVEDLGEIKAFLVNLRNQMDEEGEILHQLNDLAFASLPTTGVHGCSTSDSEAEPDLHMDLLPIEPKPEPEPVMKVEKTE